MTAVPGRSPSLLSRAWRLAPWVLAALLAALNLLTISRLGPNDDAYITYRVARNLADGLGPVYNPGERVLTITTPGYMLLLAALSPLSRNFVGLALALNALALLAVGALVIDLSRTTLAALAAVALTLTFPLLGEALGMETPLYMAAILAAFSAYRRALESAADARRQERWLMATAAAGAAAFLLRPDGALVVLAVGIHWLAGERPRRALWRALVVLAVLVLPWLAFAWLYYGSPVPNTLAAKATQALGEAIPRWGAGLGQAASDWARQFPAAAALAAAGLVLALARRRPDRLPLLLWAALYVAAHVLLGVRSYFWYYAPLAPVIALLAGDALAAAAGWLAGRSAPRPLMTAGTAALVLLALAPAALAAASLARPPELRRREEAYLQTAEALRTLCAAGDPSVGVAEVGLIGYISNCRIVDFAGLLQRDVAQLKLNPADKMAWTIKRYSPELVVLAGGVAYPFQVGDAPWFRARYEPVDIYDQDGFRSVVHRRAPGPANQRAIGVSAWRGQPEAPPMDETLYFEPGATAAISLHLFMPVRSTLDLVVNSGSPHQSFVGEPQWVDTALQPFQTDGEVNLSLALRAEDQPAAVAWIESNAIPPIHYFAPSDDASQRPRPTVRFDPGETAVIQLAPAQAGPLLLELLHRDRPGVALDIRVDGRVVATVGGSDGWRTEQIALPGGGEGETSSRPGPVTVEIRNVGTQFARLAYLWLAPDSQRGAP